MINRTMSSQHWLNPSLLQTVFPTHDPTIFLTARMMQFRVFLPFDNPVANKGNNYRRLLTDLAELARHSLKRKTLGVELQPLRLPTAEGAGWPGLCTCWDFPWPALLFRPRFMLVVSML